MQYKNFARGPRGINLKNGSTHWLEPGESVELKKEDIAGDLPDLGTEADAPAVNADQAEALAAALAEIDTLNAKVAEQAKQIEDLTKPAK